MWKSDHQPRDGERSLMFEAVTMLLIWLIIVGITFALTLANQPLKFWAWLAAGTLAIVLIGGIASAGE